MLKDFSLHFAIGQVLSASGYDLEMEEGLISKNIALKLVSAIFYQIFIFFHQMIALWKLWKMFFISSEKLFSLSIYSIFGNFFPSFPVSRFKRANGSGMIYNVINWLANFFYKKYLILKRISCMQWLFSVI